MSMSIVSEYPQPVEFDAGEDVYTITFTADGKHLVSAGQQSVQVWRVANGEQVVKMPVERDACCVAASRDGRWIAGGTSSGEVFVWDITTYELALADRIQSATILDVDFSPVLPRLVSANGYNGTATIWDVAARRKVQTLGAHLDRNPWVLAAKYSPRGDQIATATEESVCVWDGNSGRLLVDINVSVQGSRDLLWRNHHLFVQTKYNTIKQFHASTGSTLSERQVPEVDDWSCIALPQNGKFIVYSARKTLTFWDTSAHAQLGPIQYAQNIRAIACSPSGLLLAIATEGKIVIKDPSSVILHFVMEPQLHIDSAPLNAWKNDQLTNAETLLSAAIPTLQNRHHVLASRALVHARLGQWDAAIVDAEESVKIQQSVIGYIAMCMALVGKGERDEGLRVCDIAFLRFRPHFVSLLLLIKAIVLFMAGEHVNAISRINDLITDAWMDPALYVVQAYMYLLCGNKYMERGDYECAIQSFQDARIKLGSHTRRPPLIVSLISGWTFHGLAITIQKNLCEAFLAAGFMKEAGESISCVVDEVISATEPTEKWVSDFKSRCRDKLEDIGDKAVIAEQYDEAILQYTTALSLGLVDTQHLLIKRSNAYTERGKWADALNDANEVIKLDPSSLLGHERKYAALLGMGHHDDATGAFETMLSQMSESSGLEIRERSYHYGRIEHTKKTIRTSIKNAISSSPLVLIDTLSGRLCNKLEQAAAFESTPDFTTLVASMTAHIDHALIAQVVGKFYRYATLSHTWEGNEPLYERVIKTVVYNLEGLPTHKKLRMFCKVAQDEGFHWAWSDTCCINKGDNFVLQEALISMFKWYEGSAMTIIFLCDVDQLAELGALMRSLWNSRGWTLQEYHASKVVRIYTRDWTPYLGLTIYNHKESPEIITEMERATGIPAQSLVALRPGLNNIREKLRLASTRKTTRVEDAAYSLLGIFSMTLPVTYGEGDKALGRLLSQLLTSTGDTSILAWTGKRGSFNSCLPADIVVFSQPLISHVPPAITEVEMGTIAAGLHASAPDLSLATRLYDQLHGLPMPSFLAQRMKLPCLAFRTRLVSVSQNGSEFVFHAQAGALGAVEIRTRKDLTKLGPLCLVHPWIHFLLDRHAVGNMVEVTAEDDESSELDEITSLPDLSSISHVDLTSVPSPSTPLLMNEQTRMYEFLVRLRQPFGALLLASSRQNMVEYRRVATENEIRAQVEEITSATLDGLIQGVRVLLSRGHLLVSPRASSIASWLWCFAYPVC